MYELERHSRIPILRLTLAEHRDGPVSMGSMVPLH